jgi:peptidoglycan hydrolase-like protein with peptidoglycan-binding domain
MRVFSASFYKNHNILGKLILAAFLTACFASVFPVGASAASIARATDNVRLRAEPSVGSTALALVVEGSEVKVIGESGNWTKVEYEGKVGYVRSDFLIGLLGNPDGPGGALKQGSEGDAVKDLQALLTAIGVYDGPVNGKFGPLTEAAVKQFQEANGLEVDGVVGAATQKKLNEKASEQKPKSAEQAPPKAAGSSAVNPAGSSGGQPSNPAGGSGSGSAGSSASGSASSSASGSASGSASSSPGGAPSNSPGSTASSSSGGQANNPAGGSSGGAANRPSGSHITGYYYRDDEGEVIATIQKLLTEKGYYKGPINGKFGLMTEQAVMKFLVVNKLEVDGVVGRDTFAALSRPDSAPLPNAAGVEPGDAPAPSHGAAHNGANSDGAGNDTARARSASSGSSEPWATRDTSESSKGMMPDPGDVELIDWPEAKKIMAIGVAAAIYDIRSGITYNVKSFSNGMHADVEPVTRDDTALLKETYNGVWSWDPRPVWVSINGHVMAASIHGMPHGGGVNNSNGMDGQICIHFKGSSTHNGNENYAQRHQDTVIEAWEAAQTQ